MYDLDGSAALDADEDALDEPPDRPSSPTGTMTLIEAWTQPEPASRRPAVTAPVVEKLGAALRPLTPLKSG